MIGLTAVLSVAIPLLSRRWLSRQGCLAVARGMALITSGAVVGGIVVRTLLGEFEIGIDIPLGLCPLLGLLIPLAVWNPRRRMQEIFYFFVLAGTIQAILTPDLEYAFPHYGFLRYWVYHIGLVVTVIHTTTTLGFIPEKGSIWRAFGWLQVYTVGILSINLLLGTNYFYVVEKPPTPTLLDFFGPWPVYLLGGELLALALFAVVYAPALWARRRLTTSVAPGPAVVEVIRR